MSAGDSRRPSLRGLLGTTPGDLRTRLGDPEADRALDEQRWLVFELDGVGSLRCRCSPRLSSWSLTFWDPLPPTLRAAGRAVGLWPELEPDALPAESGTTLVRRGTVDREGRPVSVTALLGTRGVVRLAVFDEEPEW